MAPSTPSLRTVGFISTWPVYQGTTIDRHAHALMQGICAAARDEGCRLLLAAGASPVAERGAWRTVWPVPTEDADFVPVGPWNTDGLIIVPDDLSDAQSRYVHDLQASGFPVVFTTPEAPGPMVVVDNASGIREAVRHLVGHGHRRIAFIAGKQHRGGDSAERLGAYLQGLAAEGLPGDERLVAYGEHRSDGGRAAMRELLERGADFTAFIASNDLSCLGAIEALGEVGRSVPEDVAAIGFDDILDARSHRPSLTTVRHPTFALGYESVLALLARIDGRTADSPVVVPTRLIVRQSCGCRRDQGPQVVPGGPEAGGRADETVGEPASLERLMAEAAFGEARHSTLDQLEEQCHGIVEALAASVLERDERPLRDEVAQLLARTEERGEDPHVWQSAVSALYRGSTVLVDLAGTDRQGWLIGLLDHARLEISEQVQRQTTRALLEHMDMMTELGLLTARLPSALELAESSSILAEHLPRLGIDRSLVATYVEDDEDEGDLGAVSEVLLSTGLGREWSGLRFASREFPPHGLYPDDEPYQLILLPLRVDERTTGFVALSTTNLEPPAAIVSNLATAIRGGRLYREAVDGRRLAEEANELKGRFLSMVSHELRTPLSVVVGLSDMVVREAQHADAASPSIVRDLERMSASAEHLGRLIGDVLDLATSEAGQLRLVRQPLDLSEVLAATVVAGEQMAREKGLAWQASLPDEGPWVMGDRTRLRQIVLNLISNAVKFTDEGTVSLEVAGVGDSVTISVSDTGSGIAPVEQPLIFDEFYRVGRGARRGPGGLGLGLAISRQLAELHGGRLEVHSPGRHGVGSTFVCSLPALAPATAPGPRDQGRRVVIVTAAGRPADGDPGGSEDGEPLLATRLRDLGYGVDVERAGVAGVSVSMILDHRPGAVIVDETQASGPAWELIQHLRRQPGGVDVPVLAYRMHGEDRGAVLELDYLSKPLRPNVLADELVRRFGRGAKAHTPRILVVDDDPDILDLHARIVREAGGEPIEARTGRDALAALGDTRPDLVLLDLGMPDMDGFELLEAMRARTATQGIPVIVITGQVLTDEDLDRLNRGVASILSKGVFTVDETVARIESALSGRRGLGGATQRLVRRAIVYVEGHFAESIGRDDIARHVSISPDYLTDCFHQELGITPIAYLNRRRLREARDLLDRNDDSITNVALAVGFSDVSHFTRTFHRAVGVSPRAYRRCRRR